MKTETKYAAYRPIEPVCDQIVTKIEQGWSYRSVLKEYTLRVEALWLVVAQEIGRLRAENRALRARVRELECRRLMVATA